MQEVDSEVRKLKTDPDLPPVAVEEPHRMTGPSTLTFAIIGVLGAVGWFMIAIVRGENVNAMWFVFAAVCSYIIGFRFYSRLIEYNILKPRDTRATPAEKFENGKDFMPTDRRVLYGHHFAAIAGAGPLVGPVLAAQMGYLPGTIWIIVGVIFAGAVQDYMVMHLSIRRNGRSLGQMAAAELYMYAARITVAPRQSANASSARSVAGPRSSVSCRSWSSSWRCSASS